MLTLGVIGWIVIGGLAGWIGSKNHGDRRPNGRGAQYPRVGIVGGLIGGFLLRGFSVWMWPVGGTAVLVSDLACSGRSSCWGIVKLITRGRVSR